jgi:hypothetical protein
MTSVFVELQRKEALGWGGGFLAEHCRIPRNPWEYAFRQDPSRIPGLEVFCPITPKTVQNGLKNAKNTRKCPQNLGGRLRRPKVGARIPPASQHVWTRVAQDP